MVEALLLLQQQILLNRQQMRGRMIFCFLLCQTAGLRCQTAGLRDSLHDKGKMMEVMGGART
jgi:hypothetical protein